jgi:hypothetical protein
LEYYDKYYDGIFWIQGNEESKTIATLYIDSNGDAIISSIQSLTTNIHLDNLDGGWDKIDVVFGYINCHDKSNTYSIKLYDLWKIHESSGSLTKFKYKSSNSFIASSYDENICALKYKTIMISSDIFNDWVPKSGFKFSSDTREIYVVSHNYEQPEKIDLFRNNNFHIYIYFRAYAGYPARRNSYIKEEVFLNIETTDSFEIRELYRIKTSIERLLNILLFVPFQSTKSEFKSVSEKTYKALRKNKEFHKVISKKIEFEKFTSNSQAILSNWFLKQDKLELIINNFFSVYGHEGVLIENKFLTYISVLENYHKNYIDTKATLKKRLKYLLDNSTIKAKIEDIENYAELLKITRHYHIHLEEKHEEKALKLDEIAKANVLLEFVIRELFINEIGIDEKIENPFWIKKIETKTI